MKDIPVPTLGLSPITFLHSLFQNPFSKIASRTHHQASRAPLVHMPHAEPVAQAADHASNEISPENSSAPSQLKVVWAQHLDEVREAQRLRYAIFSGEMGAKLNDTTPGHDVDRFDDFCEHLLVRDEATDQVVGTYRLLTPVQAQRAGGLYTETEFDIGALQSLKPSMVELGRSCVHADYRSGAVIMALWGALAQFMFRNRLPCMVGCASIPMLHQGRISADAATSIWQQVSATHLADPAWHVHAHAPLPLAHRS
jgi:putative hemolysin